MIFLYTVFCDIYFIQVALRFQHVMEPVPISSNRVSRRNSESGSSKSVNTINDNNSKKENNIFMNLIAKNCLLLSFFIALGFW